MMALLAAATTSIMMVVLTVLATATTGIMVVLTLLTTATTGVVVMAILATAATGVVMMVTVLTATADLAATTAGRLVRVVIRVVVGGTHYRAGCGAFFDVAAGEYSEAGAKRGGDQDFFIIVRRR